METVQTSSITSQKWLKATVLLLTVGMILGVASTASAHGKKKKGKAIAIKTAGLAVYPGEGECTNEEGFTGPNGEGPLTEITLKFTGALEGCLYAFPQSDSYECDEETGHAVFREEGVEIFAGTFDDGDPNTTRDEGYGTIGTTYVYEATFINCTTEPIQISGGCDHPFVFGTGTGVFENVKGRFDIVDNIVDGVAVDFPYELKLRAR